MGKQPNKKDQVKKEAKASEIGTNEHLLKVIKSSIKVKNREKILSLIAREQWTKRLKL